MEDDLKNRSNMPVEELKEMYVIDPAIETFRLSKHERNTSSVGEQMLKDLIMRNQEEFMAGMRQGEQAIEAVIKKPEQTHKRNNVVDLNDIMLPSMLSQNSAVSISQLTDISQIQVFKENYEKGRGEGDVDELIADWKKNREKSPLTDTNKVAMDNLLRELVDLEETKKRFVKEFN